MISTDRKIINNKTIATEKILITLKKEDPNGPKYQSGRALANPY